MLGRRGGLCARSRWASAALAGVFLVFSLPTLSPWAVRAEPAAWRSQTSGISSDLYAVAFVDQRHGLAVGAGGTILATSNAGDSWERKMVCYSSSPCDGSSTDRVVANLRAVEFVDRAHAYVVGAAGTIVATSDGGATWKVQPSGTGIDLLSVSFTDVQSGHAVGGGFSSAAVIVATNDGGQTWRTQLACDTGAGVPCSDVTTQPLTGVSFVDADNGYAVGNSGTMLATTDGGASWQRQTSHNSGPLYAVSFSDRNNGYAVGSTGSAAAVVATDNGGGTWRPQPLCRETGPCTGSSPDLIREPLRALSFLDASRGMAVGDTGRIVATDNGGSTWVPHSSPTNVLLHGVSMVSSDRAWAVGGSGRIFVFGPDAVAEAPAPPENLRAIPGNGSITITWDPADGQGHDVTGYGVVALARAGTTPEPPVRRQVGSEVTFLTLSGLTNGRDYDIDVTALSSAGEGSPTSITSSPGLPWIPTEAMGETRFGATATVLVGGRVLVAGGSDSASAEVYDPATGAWSTTGRMIEPRRWHTATLLENGDVLVAGGIGGAGPVSSAEIYETSSGSWRSTSSMSFRRVFHSSTALAGGQKILFAGGLSEFPSSSVTGGPPVARAELFDIAKETWEEGPLMSAPRFAHTATRLSDGTVVVIGGAANDSDVRAVERYDPGLGAFVAAGSVLDGRMHSAATLLSDGTILLSGGARLLRRNDTPPTPEEVRTTERYDPTTQLSIAGNNLRARRFRHTAALLRDGRVLIAGGVGEQASELFDPAVALDAVETTMAIAVPSPTSVASVWTGSLPREVVDHVSVTLNNGAVLVAGGSSDRQHFDGFNDGEPVKVAAVLDPDSPSPTPFPSSPPRVVDVTPGSGPPSGGTEITISGLSLQRVTSVTIGGKSAQFDVVSPEKVTATCPPGGGEAEVQVTTTAGTSRASETTRFSYTEVEGSWSTVGQSIGLPRVESTATPLGDGRALVAGGSSGGTLLSSTLLYDPAKRAWSDGPSMTTARAGHTATQMSDGRVLVVGGTGLVGGKRVPIPEAEIYDPERERWLSAGALSVARRDHTATLLRTGRILVVAGQGSGDTAGQPGAYLSSTEMFDAAGGTWSLADPLTHSRRAHSATLLADGRLMVAGGVGAAGRVGASEVYDVGDGAWQLLGGSLVTPRADHSSSLLPDGTVLLVGGSSRTGVVGRSERFSISTSRWEPGPSLVTPRDGHSALSLPNGSVLVGGGREQGLSEVELYDMGRGRFVAAPPMANPRWGHAMGLLATGEVLVVGGSRTTANVPEELNSAETLLLSGHVRPQITNVEPRGGPTFGGTLVTLRGSNMAPLSEVQFGGLRAQIESSSATTVSVRAPAHSQGTVPIDLVTSDGRATSAGHSTFTYGSGAWYPAPATATPDGLARFWHATASLRDGSALLSGGTADFTSPHDVLTSVELYNARIQAWSAAAPMKTPRLNHASTTLSDGRVMVSGGQNHQQGGLSSAEIYDPVRDKWTGATPMSVPRVSHTLTPLPDGRVLAAGGSSSDDRGQQWNTAEIYDPVANVWKPTGSMADGRVNHTATPLSNGNVIVVGGYGNDHVISFLPSSTGRTTANTSVEVFDHVSARWVSSSPLSEGRADHTATLLGDNSILVAGGTGGSFDGISTAERYDPGADKWTTTPLLNDARGGHGAALLPDGKVLVAGSGPVTVGEATPGPVSSAEVYDPLENTWTMTSSMAGSRGAFSLVPLPDGTVLAAAGFRVYDSASQEFELSEGAEIYVPAPEVNVLLPAAVPVSGGVPVVLDGNGFQGVTGVRVGDIEAPHFEVHSPGRLTASAPPHEAGTVDVTVTNAGGSSALHRRARLTYLGVPGAVTDLRADGVTPSEVTLSFTAPDNGSGEAPATAFVVKQSQGAISDDSFNAALSLCEGGRCTFPSAHRISLVVKDLDPSTQYFYALRAVGFDGALGPLSNVVEVTTPSDASACPALPDLTPGQVAFRSGYSLAGAPGGTVLEPDGPLYSWVNQGAGGAYSVHERSDSLSEGHGYWAYFLCPRLAELGAGSSSARLALDGYRASMVGNPSGVVPARVSGHDFAARWDPDLNEGAGGYRISGYREDQTVAVGEGIWAFSFVPTTINLDAVP